VHALVLGLLEQRVDPSGEINVSHDGSRVRERGGRRMDPHTVQCDLEVQQPVICRD
jgi:hypothetical protein